MSSRVHTPKTPLGSGSLLERQENGVKVSDATGEDVFELLRRRWHHSKMLGGQAGITTAFVQFVNEPGLLFACLQEVRYHCMCPIALQSCLGSVQKEGGVRLQLESRKLH